MPIDFARIERQARCDHAIAAMSWRGGYCLDCGASVSVAEWQEACGHGRMLRNYLCADCGKDLR